MSLMCSEPRNDRELDRPTPEMIAAGWECLKRAGLPRLGPGQGLIEAYKAMRALAPQPELVTTPIVKAVCQHCERVTVVPRQTIRAALGSNED